MLPPERPAHPLAPGRGPKRPARCSTGRLPLHAVGSVVLLLLALGGATPAKCADGGVLLARKYRPGQSMVYVIQGQTNSKIDSNPPDLKSFFPPMPTNLRMNQQSTVDGFESATRWRGGCSAPLRQV